MNRLALGQYHQQRTNRALWDCSIEGRAVRSLPLKAGMSSMETPEDPGEPEPSDEANRAAVEAWWFWTCWLAAIALTVVGFGEAMRRILFF
jgi:hypothetical protein